MSLTLRTAQTAQTFPDHPSGHQSDVRKLVFSFCQLGASNAQVAELFDVSDETLHRWLAEIPDFADAVRRGRIMADADVANSLFRRAAGYATTEERVMMRAGAPVTVTYWKHHLPHVEACMNSLCNRRPQNWAWHGKKDAAAEDPVELYAQPLLPCPAPVDAEEAMPREGNGLPEAPIASKRKEPSADCGNALIGESVEKWASDRGSCLPSRIAPIAPMSRPGESIACRPAGGTSKSGSETSVTVRIRAFAARRESGALIRAAVAGSACSERRGRLRAEGEMGHVVLRCSRIAPFREFAH